MSVTVTEPRSPVTNPLAGETRILTPCAIRADQVVRWLLDEDLSDYEAWNRRVRAWAKKELRVR